MNIQIIRKKIRNLYLHVTSQEAIKITAPMRMSLSDIYAFIESKSAWIQKQQTKWLNRLPEPEKYYSDDEIHYFNNKPYQLKIVARTAKPSIQLTDEHIVMHIHPSAERVKRQTILEHWYGEQLKIKIFELMPIWEIKMGVCVKHISIRKMKTRWGSCSPHNQSIRINLELAKRTTECLEYIIVHELTHLLEPSHNKRFVRLMDQFLPEWRVRKKALSQGLVF